MWIAQKRAPYLFYYKQLKLLTVLETRFINQVIVNFRLKSFKINL